VKLRGRPEEPDQAPLAHNLLSARGADTRAVHGPLQRLLEDAGVEEPGDINDLSARTGIELPSVLDKGAKQRSRQVLSKHESLPGVLAMSISEAIVQSRQSDGASPLRIGHLIRDTELNLDLKGTPLGALSPELARGCNRSDHAAIRRLLTTFRRHLGHLTHLRKLAPLSRNRLDCISNQAKYCVSRLPRTEPRVCEAVPRGLCGYCLHKRNRQSVHGPCAGRWLALPGRRTPEQRGVESAAHGHY